MSPTLTLRLGAVGGGGGGGGGGEGGDCIGEFEVISVK